MKESTPTDNGNFIVNLYRESVKNVPILKYSWVLIATICILSLAAYFKLNNSDVFLYAFIVLLVSFIGFIFSSLLKSKDIFIKVALYIFIYCLIISMGVAVLSFGTFIVWQKPIFYSRWFPNQSDTLKQIQSKEGNANLNNLDSSKTEQNINIDTTNSAKKRSDSESIQTPPVRKSETKTTQENDDNIIGTAPINISSENSNFFAIVVSVTGDYNIYKNSIQINVKSGFIHYKDKTELASLKNDNRRKVVDIAFGVIKKLPEGSYSKRYSGKISVNKYLVAGETLDLKHFSCTIPIQGIPDISAYHFVVTITETSWEDDKPDTGFVYAEGTDNIIQNSLCRGVSASASCIKELFCGTPRNPNIHHSFPIF